MSIKTKFGIVVMLCIFLGVSAASLLNYSIFKKEMIDTLIARKEGVVKDIGGEVNNMLLKASHVSEMVRTDRNTVSLMRYSIAQLVNVRNLLISAQMFLSPAANIFVADMEGDVLAYSAHQVGNISEEDYFEEAKSSPYNVAMFIPHPEYPSRKDLLVAAQVRHLGTTVGIVAVLIDLYDLLSAKTGDDAFMVIDEDGGTALYTGEETQRFRQVLTDSALSAIRQERDGYIETGDHFLFFSAIPGIGGYVVLHSTKPNMYAFLNQMKTMNIVLHVLIFGLALLCANLLTRAFNVMLTHLNEAIDEAKAHEMKAVEASQAKTIFLANMSHEIRTPLNAVIGLTEIELRNDLNTQTLENLGKVHRAGTLLLSIVNDILDMSKIESGKFQLVPVKYHFASLVSDTIHQNVPLLAGKSVTFETDIDENIPVQFYGDELRIRQVLTNLLSNAFKYTDEGKVTLSIKCGGQDGESGRENEARMEFVVSDTGRGIKKEDFGRLFSEYGQLDMWKNRKVEGTGLGLSICKNLVDMMGGSIEVKSEYGKGSSFKASIRQVITDPAPIGPETARNLSTFRMEENRRGQKLTRRRIPYGKVLVVDDVFTNLDVAKGLMTPYELTVHCASGGRQAVEIMREEKTRYDLILMDHMMPEMDGIEALRAIRETGTEYAENIPVVVLTANALVGNEEFFLNNGFQGFLSKPIDILKLDAVINKWIPRNPGLEAALGEKTHETEQSDEVEENSLGGRSFSEWIHLGLDIAEGALRYGLDAYLGVIRSYATHTPALLDKLRFVSEESLKDYAVTIHGIKGSSYGISAKKVGKLAEALEDAAKDGNFTAVMRDNGPFIKEAEALLKAASDLLKESAGGESGAKEHVAAPDAELLGKLSEACSKFDIAAMDTAMDKLESYTYDSQSELVEWLREQLENLEYASMSERLEEVLGNKFIIAKEAAG
ncbi:MAG: ATP-binding protein [Synergistaceae bacterium]|nr:ATP-binding protein [Synergistaceae bacterium]